jgi:hypothetical protein
VTAPKVLLDGIELANPLVAADLPPERIDRIEVIRGPAGRRALRRRRDQRRHQRRHPPRRAGDPRGARRRA